MVQCTGLRCVIVAFLAHAQTHIHINDLLYEKIVLRGGWGWVANSKDADQPAHPRSLISAFVIRLFCDTLPRLELDDDCKAFAGLIIGQL